MSTSTVRALVALVASVLTSCPAVLAHDWYIQAADYSPARPGATTVFQGWGHKLPLDDAIAGDKIARMQRIGPDGTVKDLAVEPGRSYHAVPVDLAAPGVYTVVGESTPGLYQMYRDNDGRVHHSTRALDELTDAKEVFFSVRSFQNPKVQIVVGEPAQTACGPAGSKLEIVLDRPAGSVRAGDRLSFRLLMDGEPAPDGTTFDATYMGYSTGTEDYLYKERETAHGRGYLDIPNAGIWYIRAHLTVPAPEEMQSKCKSYLYHATLALEVGQRQRRQRGEAAGE